MNSNNQYRCVPFNKTGLEHNDLLLFVPLQIKTIKYIRKKMLYKDLSHCTSPKRSN